MVAFEERVTKLNDIGVRNLRDEPEMRVHVGAQDDGYVGPIGFVDCLNFNGIKAIDV